MTREKTSEARYFSARFNPKTSEEDKKAVEIIDEWIARGYNFKSIVTDAILRSEGYTPEMFNDPASQLLNRMEDILADFAEDLIKRIGSAPRRPVLEDNGDEGEESANGFARNFAKGFIQRQQNKG